MDNLSEDSKKKIATGLGLFLLFLFLLWLLFVLPKNRGTEETKKAEILREKERVEKEIAIIEKEKEEIAIKISETLNATTAEEDVLVKDVEIVKKDEKKLIKNSGQGYEIEIPSKMLLARSINNNELNFFLPDEKNEICCPGWRGCPSDLAISTEENPENLSVEEWVKKNKKEPYLETTGEIETYFKEFGWQKIGTNDWYKTEVFIERSVPLPTLEYFLAKGNKINVVSISEWQPFEKECKKIPFEEIEKTLNTFKLGS